MTPESTGGKPAKLKKIVDFLKKVLIWSVMVFACKLALLKTGWDKFSQFDAYVESTYQKIEVQMNAASPGSLVNKWLFRPMYSVPDKSPEAWKKVRTHNEERLARINRGESESSVPHIQFHPANIEYHDSYWTIFKTWCLGFWKKPDGGANWFGRTVLMLAILMAIPLTLSKNEVLMFFGGRWFIINLLKSLFYLIIISLLIYSLMKLVALIGSSMEAMFAGIAATSGFLSVFIGELKSEFVDFTKSRFPAFVGKFNSKKP